MAYTDNDSPQVITHPPKDVSKRLAMSADHAPLENTGDTTLAITEDELPTRIKPPAQHLEQPADQLGMVRVGSILKGRFIVDQEIGRGGMGVVYRVRDYLKEQFQDRNPYLAIKVLSEECKAHPDFLMALQREAVKAQKLAHPNIVTVYDFDSDGYNVFMTMEYLEGESLQRFLSRRGINRLPVKVSLALIDAMGQGLAYAHQKGIVHCDFKPGNVFLTNDDTVKILDFGIARAEKRPGQVQQDITRFDAGDLGALTPTYASCELLEDASPEPRDDIYSLACVAYELLAGRHPFNRLPANVARDSQLVPAPIKELNKKQWKALRRGLAFDRASRPASVTEFLAELNQQQKSPGLSRGKQAVAGIGIIFLLSIIIGYSMQYFVNQNKPLDDTPTALIPESPASAVLSAEQQKMVERLLEAAEIHFMVQRITEPEGSNAYEAYKHVLELDPGNAQANAGLKQIADYYENLAMENLPNDDTETTLAIIQTGLDVVPQHAGLRKLKEELGDKSITTRFSLWIKDSWINSFLNK
ncbi:MAG TPA: serine/threonine-protein kinase [Gammaproteobacteria bacterium]